MTESGMQILERLANSTTSGDLDSVYMEMLLRKIGYPNAVATLGVVYLTGSGSTVSIHEAAKVILKELSGGKDEHKEVPV